MNKINLAANLASSHDSAYFEEEGLQLGRDFVRTLSASERAALLAGEGDLFKIGCGFELQEGSS